MRVLMPLGLEDFELCHPIDKDDFETINVLMNGESREGSWNPLRVRLVHTDRGKKLLHSDSPWLGAHALIFRQAAVEALGPTLRKYGELLPLACSEGNLFVFNPTSIVDALDEIASSLLRFGSGRIMKVNRYVFRPAAIGEIPIFKIPNLRVSPTFVCQEIAELWERAGLTGLEFIPIWTAD
jgi:hypothetical protein